MPDKSENLLNAIRDLKRRKPFEPFRMVMASGEKYLVENPDNFAFGASEIFYFFPHSDKFVFIKASQIAAIEQFSEV